MVLTPPHPLTAESISIAPVHVVIPARLHSTRLPRKVLRPIAGRSMLEWVWRAARESNVGPVWIATDAEEIQHTALGFGAQVCLTSPAHLSGTDRCAEVAARLGWGDAVRVLNLQADEPQMPAACLQQLAALSQAHNDAVCTLYTPIQSREEFHNPAVVKLVCDVQERALYFSRAPIPWPRAEAVHWPDPLFRRHLGLYIYPVALLRRYTQLTEASLEAVEKLEQLRLLQAGIPIQLAQAVMVPPAGVDTEADWQRVNAQWPSSVAWSTAGK